MTGLAPVTTDDAHGAASGTVITGNVLTNDTDPQNHSLTALLRTNPAHGSVSLSSNGDFTYTPSVPGYLGEDSFTYWAQDGNGGWTPGTVRLSFSAVAGWRVTHFGSGGNAGLAGDLADPDGDGIANLTEFAFGLNPSQTDSQNLIVTGSTLTQRGTPAVWLQNIPNSVDFRASFCRLLNHVAAGLTYTVQFSGDLATWQNSTATPVVLAQDGGVEVVSVPYPFFVNGKKARFFRVVVTSSEP